MKENTSPDPARLRRHAELTAREEASPSPDAPQALSAEQTRQTLHELHIHQIELEMQNEELRRAQAELDTARARYFNLYDLAPVGYCTLSEQGLILEANLTAATLLGVYRGALVKKPLHRFILTEDANIYHLHRKQLFETGEPQAFELRLVREDGAALWAQLEATSAQDAAGVPVCHLVLSDITKRKRAEAALLELEILDISEREQQRTGHELHDSIGQQLHGLSYLAVLLEKGLREEGSPRALEAAQLNKYLTEALEMTRNLAHGLLPVKFLPEGLMTALRELAERNRDLYRMDCRLACPAPVLIHSHSEANHLYRIAQEAVNNAMKHAKPTRVRVRLAATGQTIILSVRDNGVGFRPRTKPGRGMGLNVMQYRANAIGGSLLIRQFPSGGTEVVCTVTRVRPGSPKRTRSNETEIPNPARPPTQAHPRGGRPPLDAGRRDPMDSTRARPRGLRRSRIRRPRPGPGRRS
jgi:PAS domain S-box-containing protein